MENLEPISGRVYRHFKGNLYKVITTAEHCDNAEKYVIYEALYGAHKVYARNL